MNIGLYGGSFNPVHNGHVAAVKEILDKKIVDEEKKALQLSAFVIFYNHYF